MSGNLCKQQCTSVGALSVALQSLNSRGFINVCHHTPSALQPNEYIICTRQGCRLCSNRTGISVVWREEQFQQAMSA